VFDSRPYPKLTHHPTAALAAAESLPTRKLQLVVPVPQPNYKPNDAEREHTHDNRERPAELFCGPHDRHADRSEEPESILPARVIRRPRPPGTRIRHGRIVNDEFRKGTAVRAFVAIERARTVSAGSQGLLKTNRIKTQARRKTTRPQSGPGVNRT
jgi:hypothetical protein